MIQLQELTYVAIITVRGPEYARPIEVAVKLLPPDKVDIYTPADGDPIVKPLRDCTLADLQKFAQQLEADIQAEYDKITMMDVAYSKDQEIAIKVVNDQRHPLPPAKEWLEKAAVVWPLDSEVTVEAAAESTDDPIEGFISPLERKAATVHESESAPILADVTTPNEEVATVDQPVIDAGNLESAPEEDQPDDQLVAADEPAIDTAGDEADESNQEQSASDKLEASDDDVLPDIDRIKIIVADSEPVFEERESTEATPVIIRKADTENRIAGKVLPQDDLTPAAVDILFEENAFRDAQNHALSSLRREVAGMLVGPPPEKQPNGRYIVRITDSIIAKHTRMHGASVTYTPESWRYINDRLMEMYPNEEGVIVGWYHTHPGFGIFLSNMDLFIHHNFFTQKWHIALVLDPIAHRSGFFAWDRMQSEVLAYNFPWPYWCHSSW